VEDGAVIEGTELFVVQQGKSAAHVANFLMGTFMVCFCLFVLIYAPGRSTARYGTVFDITDYTINQNGKETNMPVLSVLLDDGRVVEVHKPAWFHASQIKTVILQETSSLFFGLKHYSFYEDDLAAHP